MISYPDVHVYLPCLSFLLRQPLDFKQAGQIVDDDIFKMVVTPMPAGVNVTVLMDCCHSGTAFDLPYEMNATDTEMHENKGFNFAGIAPEIGMMVCCYCLMSMLLDGVMG